MSGQGYPLTPPIIAKLLRVKQQAVGVWIRRGELEAIDASESRGVRPRWRVSQEAFDAFVAARRNRKPTKVTRRRKPALAVQEFFR